tara:strand:+ start:871 stop:1767 length:897 start_codon:yes stop_codon:yes gene_type:complete
MSDETTTDRSAEREALLAALNAADTPASEQPQVSEELASDNQNDEESSNPPKQEAETKEVENEAPEQTSDAETEEKPLSNREKKSNERLNKSWDKLNSEKAALRKEREELEQMKQQASDDQASPDDYREMAERYKEDGETELAELALEKAKEVEQRRQSNERLKVAEEIQEAWNENLKDLQAQHPDLENPESEMSRGVEHVLEQRPYLKNYSEGIQDAVEFVNAKISSKQVEALQKEKGDLEAKVAELTKQTSVTGSPPGRESGSSANSQAPKEQVREKLLSALQEADDNQIGLRIFK